MRYLIIETFTADGREYIHTIELNNECVHADLRAFVRHLVAYKEVLNKVYISNTCPTNW